ncbi:MAG: DEAD/DEAH box helicase family protein [Armatimonadetes bacterium]|nr:DEAD/DEAH box helicase family protein [Armatimonadota bacterium]
MSIIEQLLGKNGTLTDFLAGYEYRPQQVEMARAVLEAFENKKHCLVEAGTGVGKTLAYLIPAILMAKKGKKILVSTHTINLQEQLVRKDIPLLAEALGDRYPFEAVVMKGRGNYLCRRNLDEYMGSLFATEDPDLSKVLAWARQTETGDVADLGFSYASWGEVSSDPDRCTRQRCGDDPGCFYYRHREIAFEADIIVVNHSLFFSDLMIKAGDPAAGVLPPYDLVIFDEAHHLEDIASKSFGVEFSNYRIPTLLGRARRLRDPGDRSKGIVDPLLISLLEERGNRLFDLFRDVRRQEFFFSDIGEPEREKAIQEEAQGIVENLDDMGRQLTFDKERHDPELRDPMDGLRRTCSRLKGDLLMLFYQPLPETFNWCEKAGGEGKGRRSLCVLRQTPVQVSNLLAAQLWPKAESAALTSATLSCSGSFEYIRSRLGLTECVEAIEGSPFDFESQSLLYVPVHFDPPSDKEEYAQTVIEEIERLVNISQGRAFVLFTSYRMLNAAYNALIGRIPYPTFKQGETSNPKLLQAFREAGDGVLFGTHSFWEGVDVQGDALSCVIIDRLPFSVPDTPTNRARVEAIEQAGGDWFYEYAMPQAQIRLKQGFGRLIRTRQDRGVVAILDSRLAKKRYGKEFLKYLPPCRKTKRLETVASFLNGGEQEA